MAAPATPSPNPNTFMWSANSVISRVGNINRKLKKTSAKHIATAMTLGWRISPDTFSICEERFSIR